jgi:hypothetical protein
MVYIKNFKPTKILHFLEPPPPPPQKKKKHCHENFKFHILVAINLQNSCRMTNRGNTVQEVGQSVWATCIHKISADEAPHGSLCTKTEFWC